VKIIRRKKPSLMGADMGRTVPGVLRRAGGPPTVAQVAERIVAPRGLDAASGAVRAAVQGSAGRALRHQRAAGPVRNPAKAGRSVLQEPGE
jgi:hypothetical protein